MVAGDPTFRAETNPDWRLRRLRGYARAFGPEPVAGWDWDWVWEQKKATRTVIRSRREASDATCLPRGAGDSIPHPAAISTLYYRFGETQILKLRYLTKRETMILGTWGEAACV